jgi:hypothetical protein
MAKNKRKSILGKNTLTMFRKAGYSPDDINMLEQLSLRWPGGKLPVLGGFVTLGLTAREIYDVYSFVGRNEALSTKYEKLVQVPLKRAGILLKKPFFINNDILFMTAWAYNPLTADDDELMNESFLQFADVISGEEFTHGDLEDYVSSYCIPELDLRKIDGFLDHFMKKGYIESVGEGNYAISEDGLKYSFSSAEENSRFYFLNSIGDFAPNFANPVLNQTERQVLLERRLDERAKRIDEAKQRLERMLAKPNH